jgi:hypothetical protein
MKLKILFVVKLFFFVSIELSAPYCVSDYQPEFNEYTKTGNQVFGSNRFDEGSSVMSVELNNSAQMTDILNGIVD